MRTSFNIPDDIVEEFDREANPWELIYIGILVYLFR